MHIIFSITISRKKLSLTVKNESGIRLANYFFESNSNLTDRDEYIITPLLTVWSILDLARASSISIQYDLSIAQGKYVTSMVELCMKAYAELYGIPYPIIYFDQEVKDSKWMLTERKIPILGFSGGRDSFLTKLILEELNIDYETFTVNFEQEIEDRDSRIDVTYLSDDASKFKISNAESIERASVNHQADDVHLTFITPLLKNKNTYNSEVLVGLPLEAVLANDDINYVPTETYASLEILKKFLISAGFQKVRFLSLISPLHSTAIYRMIEDLSLKSKGKTLDSCWNSFSFENDVQCGCCIKCQRIKYIYRKVYDEEILEYAPFLSLEEDHLFSSVCNMELLENVHLSYFVDNQINHLCGPYASELSRLYEGLGYNKRSCNEIRYYDIRLPASEKILGDILKIVELNEGFPKIKPSLSYMHIPFNELLPHDILNGICEKVNIVNYKLVFKNYNIYRTLFDYWLSTSRNFI